MGGRNIWILDQYAVTPGESGIIRQYEHADLLRDHGWHARVMASPYNHKTHTMDRPVSLRNRRIDIQERGVDFSWVYSTPYTRNDLRRYVNMVSYLVTSQIRIKGAEKPDVVLGSSPHLLTALSAWIISKRFRIPFIFEVRDLWPESLVQLGLTNPAIIKPLVWIEEFLDQQATAIVALTEGIGTNIQSRIKDPEKVVLLPNAVRKPTRITSQRRAEVRQQMGWHDGEIVAIYAGAHGDANDLGQIVETAKKLATNHEIRFILLGDGPTKAGLISKASGLENIDFVDSVPKDEIGDILQSADIGLLTLKPVPLFEGARPNKLFDYMGAGLPVISTVKGEAERVLTESGSGVAVNPGDLCSAVARFAADDGLRLQLSNSGFHHASTVQTREDVVRDFAKLLDDLVNV